MTEVCLQECQVASLGVAGAAATVSRFSPRRSRGTTLRHALTRLHAALPGGGSLKFHPRAT